MTMPRDLQIEFAIYNAGIVRSRREYNAHPSAQDCTPRHRCYVNQAKHLEQAARWKENHAHR